MSSLNYFTAGIARAVAKRKEQQSKQSIQTTQKVCSDASNTIATTNTIVKVSDEQYRTTIIQKMINHIRQKKEKNND